MKKITLALAAALLSLGAFAQTMEFTNTLPTEVELGGTIDADYSFDSGENNTTGFSFALLRTVDASGTVVTNNIGAQQEFDLVTTQTGSGSITYTVPSDIVASSDLPDGESYEFLQYVTYKLDGMGADIFSNSAIVPITITSSLSVDDLSSVELSDFSYDSDSDEVTLAKAGDYSVYNLAGSVVAEGSSATISLAGLVDGVYIIAAENGTTKVVKF